MKQSNNKTITVSAPGKLMLFGEHAVVYGRPCIVTAVGQRMRATVELTNEPILQLDAPDVQIIDYKKPMSQLGKGEIPKGAKFVEIAIKNFTFLHRKWEGGVRISTSSEFSSEFGFGSSSASTVCVIKALSELTKAKLFNKAIFKLAYQTVLDIQGKGSGFDVAAAIYGGTLYFVTGGKVIKSLNIKSLSLIVGYSGVKTDTVTLVNQVADRAKKYPEQIENIYNSIQTLVEDAKKVLLKEDWQSLGELMDINQGYLESLGVSIRKLSHMIYAAREAGAYGAKLSGAGGGDCMIAVGPNNRRKEIEGAITQADGQVIKVDTNVEGIRVEK